MPRLCQILGTKPLSGHNVSHSERKTKRVFNPNLQDASFFSDILGVRVKFRASARAIKSVEKNGGIDSYLLGRGNSRLSPEALRIKARIAGAAEKKGA
ncbi:MAG: 50S ribosomal protein L28 [Rickettsiales bacterium]|nr:50S ribosomal protein L28 [Rickettsiales bacterium]